MRSFENSPGIRQCAPGPWSSGSRGGSLVSVRRRYVWMRNPRNGAWRRRRVLTIATARTSKPVCAVRAVISLRQIQEVDMQGTAKRAPARSRLIGPVLLCLLSLAPLASAFAQNAPAPQAPAGASSPAIPQTPLQRMRAEIAGDTALAADERQVLLARADALLDEQSRPQFSIAADGEISADIPSRAPHPKSSPILRRTVRRGRSTARRRRCGWNCSSNTRSANCWPVRCAHSTASAPC